MIVSHYQSDHKVRMWQPQNRELGDETATIQICKK